MFNPLYVKDILSNRKLLYKDVYAGSGINENTFKGIMSSKGGNPSANILEALADFLECSIDDFFDRKFKKEDKALVRQVSNENSDESILYKMYKEKDTEVGMLREEIGQLKERIENLNLEITLNKLSSGSVAVESAKNVTVPVKEKETL